MQTILKYFLWTTPSLIIKELSPTSIMTKCYCMTKIMLSYAKDHSMRTRMGSILSRQKERQ
jgi:hypothetical protein